MENRIPPWSALDTIMFDMDGTLLDLHFDNFFWQVLVPRIYSQTKGISEEAAREFIHRRYAGVRGTLDWYCLDYWEEELGLDIVSLKSTIKHKIKVRPSVERILQELQASDKRLLLITNAHPSSLRIKLEHTGLADYFHRCISSHSLKLAKENHGFWESLQKIEPYQPERTILFDDSLPVLRQAKREGIKHLFAIKQPDSQKAPLDGEEFPQVDDFDHILPSLSPDHELRKNGLRQNEQ